MPSLHSIRLRLTLAVGLLVGAIAAIFAVSAYAWFRVSLEDDLRSFALHEAEEVAQAVASATDLGSDARAALGRLMPEQDVLAVEVWTLDGVRAYAHPASVAGVEWPEGLHRVRAEGSVGVREATRVDADGVRAARLISYGREPRWIAMTWVSRDRVTGLLSQFRRSAAIGFASVVLLVLGGSYWVLGRALSPMRELVHEALVVSRGPPGGRLAEPPPGSELAGLATLLNRMLAQTEESLSRLRTFTANAGHELRTPLTRMRADVEQALAIAADDAKTAAVLESVLEELDSMRVLLDGLLDLARGEESLGGRVERVDLAGLVAEVATEARVVAGEQGVEVVLSRTAPASVDGSRALLGRLLWNLIDNSLHAVSPGGRIEVRVLTHGGTVSIEVEDDGPGVGTDGPEQLFRPFVRGERSAARRGHGLGLALGRAIARRHGGELSWMPAGRLCGARIQLRLPLAADAGPETARVSGASPGPG